MPSDPFDRRTFQHASLAALGGLLAGAAGCGQKQPAATALTPELHLCRGLNECKGLGKGGDNDCRGQGSCATIAEHSCHGENLCQGQGGCGATAGINECKGQGGCHVPLMDAAWEKVHARLTKKWKEENKPFQVPEKK